MISEEERREREIRQKLDEVVGTDFDAPHARTLGSWIRSRWLKWALGLLVALGAPLLIVYIIESHRLPPVVPKAAQKPVTVEIIPAR